MDTSFYSEDVKFTPYWWEAAPRVAAPEATAPERADVVIVGSGYTGLSAALTLARAYRQHAIICAGSDAVPHLVVATA